jgi:hypothetical protein
VVSHVWGKAFPDLNYICPCQNVLPVYVGIGTLEGDSIVVARFG